MRNFSGQRSSFKLYSRKGAYDSLALVALFHVPYSKYLLRHLFSLFIMLTTLPGNLWSTLLGTLLYLPTVASAQGDQCSCFRTNGSSAGYFTSHRFLDYRNVSPASPEVPPLSSNITNTTNAFATSRFFLEDAWRNDWTIQNWNNTDNVRSSAASVFMVNSPNNVYIGSQDFLSFLEFILTVFLPRKEQRQ